VRPPDPESREQEEPSTLCLRHATTGVEGRWWKSQRGGEGRRGREKRTEGSQCAPRGTSLGTSQACGVGAGKERREGSEGEEEEGNARDRRSESKWETKRMQHLQREAGSPQV
jgi:hypothetical protein